MKRLLMYLVIFCLPVYIYCQSPNIKGSYEYPVRTSSAEWKSLKDRSERVEVCQIPNTILKKLTTKQLLETCLHYPFMVDILAFNDVQMGFTKVASEFNGLQEFLRRKDNARALLDCYSKINPNSIHDSSLGREKGFFLLKMTYIEILLSQEEVLTNFSDVTKIIALEELVSKYEEKKAISYYKGNFFSSVLARSLNKTLHRLNGEQSNLKSAQIDIDSHNEAVLNPDLVYYKAKEYLRNIKTNQK